MTSKIIKALKKIRTILSEARNTINSAVTLLNVLLLVIHKGMENFDQIKELLK